MKNYGRNNWIAHKFYYMRSSDIFLKISKIEIIRFILHWDKKEQIYSLLEWLLRITQSILKRISSKDIRLPMYFSGWLVGAHNDTLNPISQSPVRANHEFKI